MSSLAARAKELRPSALPQLLKSLLPLVVGIALAFVLQLTVERTFGPFVAKVMTDIGINIMLAVSLNMVNGFTGQFSIGHAGMMAVGGYTAAWITYYGSIFLWGSTALRGGFLGSGDLLFLGSCLVGGLTAALAGLVVGLPSLRLRGDYLAIVTLGFGEILRVMLQRTGDVVTDAETVRSSSALDLATHLGGALGFTGIPFYTSLFYVTCFATITILIAYRIKRSSTGRALLSIREDEVAAEAMGINTTRLKVTAFVLAAFFAGIAGALFAHEVGTTLNPRELGFQKSFDIVIMVVLGGMGSISGSALAAVLLTVLPELLREFAEYRMIVYALVLVVMMIVRPQGIFGLKEIWDYQPIKGLLQRFPVTAPLLEVKGASIAFGGLKAVDSFDLALPAGSLHGLIGPNGAGKTTVFNVLTGVYAADTGTIALGGRSLRGLRPYQIASAGMARTFQNIRLFGNLSVLDNVQIASHCRSIGTLAGAVLRDAGSIGEERAIEERAHRLLEIFGLDGRAEEQARNLPYGDQRRLEIARALSTSPSVLLLDEPAAGMNPHEKFALKALVQQVRKDFAVTILLIEHDMGVVMDICEYITVLNHGQIIAVGTPAELQKDPKVIEAYLGIAESSEEA